MVEVPEHLINESESVEVSQDHIDMEKAGVAAHVERRQGLVTWNSDLGPFIMRRGALTIMT